MPGFQEGGVKPPYCGRSKQRPYFAAAVVAVSAMAKRCL